MYRFFTACFPYLFLGWSIRQVEVESFPGSTIRQPRNENALSAGQKTPFNPFLEEDTIHQKRKKNCAASTLYRFIEPLKKFLHCDIKNCLTQQNEEELRLKKQKISKQT